ncbi:metallophosphoesterase [Anaerobacillus sp. CMMVII]|uniref:metallophosphoesterase n=1 Tax=Anaerobacillus sp. CMMVII TaxID=2755588 RepID=UPI0021B737FD|nr:metallophosphoesterase [Anaerobacillus sp. CMMVII]MCT8138134.1 metallophosphoesterase [Anaerobacillus sp. CMMVII]
MKKLGGIRLFIGLTLLFCVLIIFTFWNNNRIKIVEEEVKVYNLPIDLDGFTIVQLSDLHEKQFRKDQKKLIDTVNSLRYDAIVFTGDMLDGRKSKNYQPFYTLIEGLNNKETALFVPGNSDPAIYRLNPFQKSDFIKGMEERGVKLLESVHSLYVGNSMLHFVEFELSIENKDLMLSQLERRLNRENEPHPEYFRHRKKLFEDLSQIDELGSEGVLIALSHYPIVDKRLDLIASDSRFHLREFDLLIAGHYHGGQIRLPFFGALFVPESFSDRKGFFPPQNRVKGLWNYKGINQYVSAGLGSSDAIPFLNFRLLNPPEVNIIILKAK